MKKEQRRSTILLTIMILLSATGRCVLAETAKVQPSDLVIQVDFSKPAGVLKPLNGVNGGPRAVGRHTGDMVTLHKEAGFPSVRLHDCHWPHPDVVLKADYQDQDNESNTGEEKGFNLGIGYQF